MHLLSASQYDPARDCLSESTVIDVLEGDEPVRCDQVVCWLNRNNEAFVTAGVCDGPVGWKRVDEPTSGTVCDAALWAYEHGGMGSCSAPQVDAAPDEAADASQEDAG